MGIPKLKPLTVAAALSIALAGCIDSDNSDNSENKNKALDNTTISVSGIVADGYLINATVCLDLNNNKSCDVNEPQATTDTDGKYSFTASEADVKKSLVISVITAGVTTDKDDETRVLKAYVMSAPVGKSEFISPITTMIQVEIESIPGLSVEAAENRVKENLGYNTTDEVDLFKDFIAAQDAASGSSAEEQVQYKRLYRIAQVTARAFENNQTEIEAAANATGLSKEEILNELTRLVVKQVIEEMNEITAVVDNTAIEDDFNPDAQENIVSIKVDTKTLKEDVLIEETVSNSVKGDANSFFSLGSWSIERGYDDESYVRISFEKLLPTGKFINISETWDGSRWVTEPTMEDFEQDNYSYSQALTPSGLIVYEDDSVLFSFSNNSDDIPNLIVTDGNSNVLGGFTVKVSEISVAGKNIKNVYESGKNEYNESPRLNLIPDNAIFSENTKRYSFVASSAGDDYSIDYIEANESCPEIGDTSLSQSRNCKALRDLSGNPVAATDLNALTMGVSYDLDIGYSNDVRTIALTAIDSEKGNISYSMTDANGEMTSVIGTYEIVAPFEGAVKVIKFTPPFSTDGDSLLIVINEGYARLGYWSLKYSFASSSYNEVAINDIKNCFEDGSADGTGLCQIKAGTTEVDEQPKAEVITLSGKTASIVGTWKYECHKHDDGGGDAYKFLAFTNETAEFGTKTFTSTDGTCTGAEDPLETYSIVGTLDIGETNAISGWFDSAIPTAQDGSGSLPETGSYIQLKMTTTKGTGAAAMEAVDGNVTIGEEFSFSFVVDATGTMTVAYDVNNDEETGSWYANQSDKLIKQ